MASPSPKTAASAGHPELPDTTRNDYVDTVAALRQALRLYRRREGTDSGTVTKPFNPPPCVCECGRRCSRVVRYRNNATGPGNARKTLGWAAPVDRVAGQINGTIHGLEQLLGQLADGVRAYADDPTVYDDRRDRPGADTALLAAEEITAARPHVLRLARQLATARA